MTLYTNQVVYPEGDIQEIPHRLRVNQVVDLNGYPLPLPLPTYKLIAYRVFRISTQETRGEIVTSFYLELLNRDMLSEYLR